MRGAASQFAVRDWVAPGADPSAPRVSLPAEPWLTHVPAAAVPDGDSAKAIAAVLALPEGRGLTGKQIEALTGVSARSAGNIMRSAALRGEVIGTPHVDRNYNRMMVWSPRR
jgi:hypothetical protein